MFYPHQLEALQWVPKLFIFPPMKPYQWRLKTNKNTTVLLERKCILTIFLSFRVHELFIVFMTVLNSLKEKYFFKKQTYWKRAGLEETHQC